MTSQSPVSLLHKASGWSIAWGVLLIVFGVLAIGAPLLAAVAVNALIAWLIVLAGVVHLFLAFHTHGAGSVIWKLLVGLAYIVFGGYLLMHPLLGIASLTLVLASLFLIEGVLDVVLYAKMRPARGAGWVLFDGVVTLLLSLLIWAPLAVEFGLGDRHAGRREHDHERSHAIDDVDGSAADERTHDVAESCVTNPWSTDRIDSRRRSS